MRLIVHELLTSLSQTVTPDKNTNVNAIRPHLYLHNSPVGTLKVQIKTMGGALVGESNELDMSDITTAAYFHGYVRFNVKAYLKKDTTYSVSIVAGGGYSFSESAYCGVCNDFDFRKYPAGYTPSTGLNAALDIEIWALSSK